MKVNKRKLGREKAYGLAHQDDDLIEIDPRIKGRLQLEIYIHEALHLLYPKLSESRVLKDSKKVTSMLWKEGYRKIEK